MAKKLFITCILTPILIFTNNAFSQQTNANEDYSSYLPEGKSLQSTTCTTCTHAAGGLYINQRRFVGCTEFYGARQFYENSATTFCKIYSGACGKSCTQNFQNLIQSVR